AIGLPGGQILQRLLEHPGALCLGLGGGAGRSSLGFGQARALALRSRFGLGPLGAGPGDDAVGGVLSAHVDGDLGTLRGDVGHVTGFALIALV
ncbi:hypothetical protein H4F31_24875, partial [Escherichia coli]|nr:hypothetical protein [Escherichia coli]